MVIRALDEQRVTVGRGENISGDSAAGQPNARLRRIQSTCQRGFDLGLECPAGQSGTS